MNATAARGIVLIVSLALAVPGAAATGRLVAHTLRAPQTTAVKDQHANTYAKLPLSFIPNAGQADPRVLYSAQGPGFTVSFTREEALLSFVKGEQGHVLGIRFLGANTEASLAARGPLAGTVNYLIGDPTEWRTGLPTYEEVVYGDLWPGVDMVFRGGEGKLKYEFHLAPGARADDVRLSYRGADGLGLGRGGELLIHTPLGTLIDARPTSYQPIAGNRVTVDSRYVVGPDGTYGFALGPGYDPRRPVVIDPELVYSTFVGGGDFETSYDIAVDRAGQAYVTGETWSGNFPITPGAFDSTIEGGVAAFVTKLSREGSGLLYSTFLGGEFEESGDSIGVDSAGHAYVIGTTSSSDFPTTPGAFDTTFNGYLDAFVTKLNPDGSGLLYSTFLGGAAGDRGNGIGVDSAGHAYVTGETSSAEFPTTPGAFDTTLNGADAFITKLSRDGSALVYSTFLGGTGGEVGRGIWVHIGLVAGGHAYVAGSTSSPDFPATPGAFDTSFNGLLDAFVTKLSVDGSGLEYSTFLGGGSSDSGQRIVAGPAGHAYVIGHTESLDFPATPGAFDTSFNGRLDAFVTKLSPEGSALSYSTFLGNGETEGGNDIAVDRAGHAYVTGFTFSPGFPTTPGAFDPTYNGDADAFVTMLSPEGSALLYSTFLGGASLDSGNGIGVDVEPRAANHIYVTGASESPDFPTTPGAFDTTPNGSWDVFVSKFVIN